LAAEGPILRLRKTVLTSFAIRDPLISTFNDDSPVSCVHASMLTFS